MRNGALRISAITLGVAALVSFPLTEATAATADHHRAHAAHARVAHAHHGYASRHYVWRNGHRYAYGYDPGAAVAAGVAGAILGAAAGYPYDCSSYYYGPYYG